MTLLKSVFIALVLAVSLLEFACGQALTAADCGTTVECFKSPNACTSSDDCDYLIKYKYNQTTQMIDIDLSGRVTGWVAFGFNSVTNSMTGTKGEICIQGTSLKLLEFEATAKSTPNTRDSTFTTTSTRSVNGALICSYSRPVAAPSNSYSVDLAQSWYLYTAFGSGVTGDVPSYHGRDNYASTSDERNVSSAAVVPPTPQVTQPPQSDELTTADCDIAVGCFKEPSTCTSSRDCTFLIKYKYDANTEQFDIDMSSTASGWVAFGFSKSASAMVGLRGEMCIQASPLKLIDFENVGYRAPSTSDSPFTIRSLKTVNGALICRYTRPLTLSGVTHSVNLNDTWHIYGVWGDGAAGDVPLYHGVGNYSFTLDQRNLSSANQSIAPTSSTASVAVSSTAVVPPTPQVTQPPQSDELTTANCNMGVGCFKEPSTCTSSRDCKFLIKYKYDASTEQFDIDMSSTASGWVAFGFSKSANAMVGLHGEMCIQASPLKLIDFKNTGYSPPSTSDSLFTIRSLKTVNGALICRYTRPLTPSGVTNSVDLNETWHIYGVWGNRASGGVPLQHNSGDYRWSSSEVSLKIAASILTKVKSRTLLAAHGCVMVIAWVALAWIGFFSARYMKPAFKEACGIKIWFWIHRICMASAFLLTILGIIFVFAYKEKWSESAQTHAVIGIIVTALALLQVFFATFRPAPDAKHRWIFNWVHRAQGYIALVLAVVNCFLGLDEIAVTIAPMIVFAIVAGLVIIIVEIHVLMSPAVRSNSKVEYNPGQQMTKMGMPGEEIDSSPSEKGLMIRKLIFFLFALFVSCCALACVIIIAKELS